MVTAKVQDKAADGIGAAAAIIENLGIVIVARHALILFKCVDEVKKWVRWQLPAPNGMRKGNKNGGLGAPGKALEGLGAEVGQEAQGFGGVADLVAEVVGNAAKSVNIAEILPEMPR